MQDYFNLMVDLSVALSVILLIIFLTFYYILNRKSEIGGAAETAGYENPKQFMSIKRNSISRWAPANYIRGNN